MKKIIYSLLFVAIVTGCYEDKGNYDYKLDSMNEITNVTFSPSISETTKGKVIEVQQALDENNTQRRIEVTLEQTLSDNFDKLHFYWFRTYTDAGGKIVKDTIHSKGFLEFDLPVGKEMEYDIFLQIYDETTTLSHYSKFKIMTRPMFKNSLFVLHGNEGERKLGNIEIIGNDTKVRTDITSMTPEQNYSNAVGLAYTTYLGKSQDKISEEVNTLIVFNQDGDAKAYNPFGMIWKFATEDILRPQNNNFTFKKMMQTGSSFEGAGLRRIAISEEGEVYIANHTHAFYKPGYQYEIEGGSEKHQSDYQITAATIEEQRFVFWDAKHNRFLFCASSQNNSDFPTFEIEENQKQMSTVEMKDAYIDFTTLDKSPEGMTAILGYVNYKDNYDQNNVYFIFKDEATNEFYRYELTRIKIENEKANSIDREVNKPTFSIEGEKLKGFMPDCDISTVTYNSWFTTNYLFYSNGKAIYRYSILSGDNIPVYTAPEGYNITMMKFRNADSSPNTGELGRVLSIALYNGTNGAVAEIMFNTAADVDEDFEPLFYDKGDDGDTWGKIKDLQFVNEATYKNPFNE